MLESCKLWLLSTAVVYCLLWQLSATSTVNLPPYQKKVLDCLDSHVIGHDEAKLELSAMALDHHMSMAHDHSQSKCCHGFEDSREQVSCSKAACNQNCDSDANQQKKNVLLLGPQNSGKKHLVSSLAKCIQVAFSIFDCSSVPGSKGIDVKKVASQLFRDSGRDMKRAEKSIVLLDGISWLSTVDFEQEHHSKTLGMIGGASIRIYDLLDVKSPYKTLDTSNVLFVASGGFYENIPMKAFEGVESINKIWFRFSTSAVKDEDNVGTDDVMSKAGVKLNRYFPVRLTLKPFDAEVLARILVEPKDSLVKKYIKKFAAHGVELTFTKTALQSIATMALEERSGHESLEGVLSDILSKPFATIHCSNITAIRITKDLHNPAYTVDELSKQLLSKYSLRIASCNRDGKDPKKVVVSSLPVQVLDQPKMPSSDIISVSQSSVLMYRLGDGHFRAMITGFLSIADDILYSPEFSAHGVVWRLRLNSHEQSGTRYLAAHLLHERSARLQTEVRVDVVLHGRRWWVWNYADWISTRFSDELRISGFANFITWRRVTFCYVINNVLYLDVKISQPK